MCVGTLAFGLVGMMGPAAPPVLPAEPAAAQTVQMAAAALPAPPGAAATEALKPAATEAPKAAPAESEKPAIPEPPQPAPEKAQEPAAPAPPPAAQEPAPAKAAPEAPAPAPQPAPLTTEQKAERIHKAATLLMEANTALGVPKSPYGQLIYEIAVRHSINPHLVAAVIHVESSFNPKAVSRKGAVGLMQLLPATARRFGLKKTKDLYDPVKNLEAGVRYLKWLTNRFGGDVQKALAAYNAGEGAVDRFGGIPPYRETQNYVKKIFGLLGFTTIPAKPDLGEDTPEMALSR